jgi:hypothetical protein
MAEAAIGATSGWGHLPWLAPRLIVGFLYVFLIFPIPWYLYHSTATVVNPNLSFSVFTQFWNWIAIDSNHLWLAVVVALVVGFLASDYVTYWNSFALRLLEIMRIKGPLLGQLARARTALSPTYDQEIRDSPIVDLEEYKKSLNEAGFRVWLFSYANGAPVKYLDWHGFNSELVNKSYNAFFLFLQAWIVWGLYSLLWVPTSSFGGVWFANPGSWGWALIEWSMVLALGFFLCLTTYSRKRLWVIYVRNTWVSLYEFWKEEERKKAQARAAS